MLLSAVRRLGRLRGQGRARGAWEGSRSHRRNAWESRMSISVRCPNPPSTPSIVASTESQYLRQWPGAMAGGRVRAAGEPGGAGRAGLGGPSKGCRSARMCVCGCRTETHSAALPYHFPRSRLSLPSPTMPTPVAAAAATVGSVDDAASSRLRLPVLLPAAGASAIVAMSLLTPRSSVRVGRATVPVSTG